MAGIIGIVPRYKVAASEIPELESSLAKMLSKLVYYPEQKTKIFCSKDIFMGNAIPISTKINNCYLKNKNFPCHFVIEGIAFISDFEKRVCESKYELQTVNHDHDYIPFLFDNYGDEFVHHVTGTFNIFIHNEATNDNLIFNDRLGFLPLYYYCDDNYFIFSSKIEPILISGLMKSIDYDEVTIAEHLFFNYPLSDYTYIKTIRTLADASRLVIEHNKINIFHYWDIGELFEVPTLNKKQSVLAINKGIERSLQKLFKRAPGKVNFTLTGGWDSRLVLAYLLPDYRRRLNVFSFGASDADDILIPEQIANIENLTYTPYILDQTYLEKEFIPNALDTITLSNGTRSYKRAHYIYAIKKIADISEIMLTGIFGDEVLKVGKPKGGNVISKNAIDFIESGFDVELIIDRITKSGIDILFDIPELQLESELRVRFDYISNKYLRYIQSGQQYFAFRFGLNLRKYFGNEANSYNDFVYCFSPFFDYDFLKQLARSRYMTSRFPFETPSLKLKAQSSWFYFKLVKENYNNLTAYNSSRGFSMKDTSSPRGIVKLMLEKIMRWSKPHKDDYNTGEANKIFYNFLLKNDAFKNLQGAKYLNSNLMMEDKDRHLSLIYWLVVNQSCSWK